MTSALPLEFAFNALVFVFFLGFWLITFVLLYHFTRFGVGVQPKRLAGALFLGSLILFSTTLVLFIKLDVGLLMPK